jgi:hypothetical protein
MYLLYHAGSLAFLPRCCCCSLSLSLGNPNLDPETILPSNAASNSEKSVSWRYWISCERDRWMYCSTPWATASYIGLFITCTRQIMVTTGASITQELGAGTLMVSLTSVKDVENAVALSKQAAMIMNGMLVGQWPMHKDSVDYWQRLDLSGPLGWTLCLPTPAKHSRV